MSFMIFGPFCSFDYEAKIRRKNTWEKEGKKSVRSRRNFPIRNSEKIQRTTELFFQFNNWKNHCITFEKFLDYFPSLITEKIVDPFSRILIRKIPPEPLEGIHGFLSPFFSLYFRVFSRVFPVLYLRHKSKMRYRILAVSRFRTPAILFVVSHV